MTPDALRARLLDPADTVQMSAAGKVDAAVLVPLFEDERGLVAVFTERRADLRKHPGEISFPGGRRDPDEDLLDTALREAEEEIGLTRDKVDVVGALKPIGTFVTGFRVYPFVGVIPAGSTWVPQETEVAQVLELPVAELVRGHRHERLWRKGVPVRTPTYTVDGHLVWGATARMVEQLLARLT
jgi:8-oxo-dGTP pyrophosphatase MutT (NUDIX family)